MSLGEVLTGLGFLTGLVILWLSARSANLDTSGMRIVAIAGFLCGIAGAKVTQLVFSGWPIQVPLWTIFDPKAGGKALFGGLLVGWLAVVLAKRKLGIRRSTGDHFALALPAGEAIGRLGCHFNECCFGRVCNLPWAIHQHGADRHPTQLYSAITAALIFISLIIAKRKFGREGDLWRLFLILFATTRFGLEFLRENTAAFLGLSAMQWFCLELLGYVIVSGFWRARSFPQESQLT